MPKQFWPKDDDDTIYIESSINFVDLQKLIQDKWGAVDFAQIEITSDYIHTDCLTYDLYDSSDWTKFLIISRQK